MFLQSVDLPTFRKCVSNAGPPVLKQEYVIGFLFEMQLKLGFPPVMYNFAQLKYGSPPLPTNMAVCST